MWIIVLTEKYCNQCVEICKDMKINMYKVSGSAQCRRSRVEYDPIDLTEISNVLESLSW